MTAVRATEPSVVYPVSFAAHIAEQLPAQPMRDSQIADTGWLPDLLAPIPVVARLPQELAAAEGSTAEDVFAVETAAFVPVAGLQAAAQQGSRLPCLALPETFGFHLPGRGFSARVADEEEFPLLFCLAQAEWAFLGHACSCGPW